MRHFAARLCFVAVLVSIAAMLAGCDAQDAGTGELLGVWGRRGISDGRFQKPRAVAIDANDEIYVVDMTARIQVFDSSGAYLRGWSTPAHDVGRPSGLSIDRSGRLLVADTHYYRVLVYSPEGELLETLGGTFGNQPGEFGLVTDAVQDSAGNFYVAEYGEYDRIQKFTPEGEFVLQWGGHGSEPGQFVRPQNLAIDSGDNIWVADACNHRIQIFDSSGKLLKLWGTMGPEIGQLYYPYDLVLDGAGDVYVCEFGNNRIQKFTPDGESLGHWGTTGRRDGELHNPWAIVQDTSSAIHIIDTNNHRVQRISL